MTAVTQSMLLLGCPRLLDGRHAAADDGLAGLAQLQEFALVGVRQHHRQCAALHYQPHPLPAECGATKGLSELQTLEHDRTRVEAANQIGACRRTDGMCSAVAATAGGPGSFLRESIWQSFPIKFNT